MISQEGGAVCLFTVDDVLDAREEFSAEQAELFLEQNRKHIVDAMCAAGFEAINSLWLEEKE